MVEAKQYGSGEVSIDKVWLQSTSNTPINTVGSGGEFQWCFTLTANSDVEHPVFSMMIKTVEGVAIFGTDSAQFPNIPKRLVATSCHTVSFSLHANLAPGLLLYELWRSYGQAVRYSVRGSPCRLWGIARYFQY